MADTVRASRSLYRAALSDAIDWNQSLVDGGGGDEHTLALLARYRKALAALGGLPAEPEGRLVALQDVEPNWPFEED